MIPPLTGTDDDVAVKKSIPIFAYNPLSTGVVYEVSVASTENSKNAECILLYKLAQIPVEDQLAKCRVWPHFIFINRHNKIVHITVIDSILIEPMSATYALTFYVLLH